MSMAERAIYRIAHPLSGAARVSTSTGSHCLCDASATATSSCPALDLLSKVGRVLGGRMFEVHELPQAARLSLASEASDSSSSSDYCSWT